MYLSALTLMARWQEGHPADKKFCQNNISGSPWRNDGRMWSASHKHCCCQGGTLPWSWRSKQPSHLSQCSWHMMEAWCPWACWPSREHCYCHRRGASLKPSQPLQCSWLLMAACCQSWTLLICHTSVLWFCWLTCKNSATTTPVSLALVTGRAVSYLSGEMGRLNQGSDTRVHTQKNPPWVKQELSVCNFGHLRHLVKFCSRTTRRCDCAFEVSWTEQF